MTLTESHAPETVTLEVPAVPEPSAPENIVTAPALVEPDPPQFYGAWGRGAHQTITLIGGGPLDGRYRHPLPLPIDLSYECDMYTLSDRAAGLYVHRVK